MMMMEPAAMKQPTSDTLARLRKICAHPFVFDFTDDDSRFVLELVQHLNATLAQRGSQYRFKVAPWRRSSKSDRST